MTRLADSRNHSGVLGYFIALSVGISTVMLIEVVNPRVRPIERVDRVPGAPGVERPSEGESEGEAIAPVHAEEASEPVASSSRTAPPAHDAVEVDAEKPPIEGGESPSLPPPSDPDGDYLAGIHEAFAPAKSESEFLRRYGTLATTVLGADWAIRDGERGHGPPTVAEPFFQAYRRISEVNLAAPSPMSIRYSKPRDQLVQVMAFRSGSGIWVLGGEDFGLPEIDPAGLARMLAGGVGRHIPFKNLSPEQQEALIGVCRDWDIENRQAKRRLWEFIRPLVIERARSEASVAEVAGFVVRDNAIHVFRPGEDGDLDALLNERGVIATAMYQRLRVSLGQ